MACGRFHDANKLYSEKRWAATRDRATKRAPLQKNQQFEWIPTEKK